MITTVSTSTPLTPPPSPRKDSPFFVEAIKRLSKDDQQKLIEQLDKLVTDEHIEILLKALDGQDWNNDIFQNENFPFYALEALRRGRLSQTEFGTVCLYWSALQYHKGGKDVVAVPIFKPDGSVNPEAKKIILESLQNEHLSHAEITALFEKLSTLPRSEQQLFIMPDLQSTASGYTVSQAILGRTGINTFNRLSGDRRILPTIGLMQAYLDVHYGDAAVKINPVLGLSSLQDIAQKGITSVCDLAVHFPGVTLPTQADNSEAPWYDFSYHDFYHAILASGIPCEHRTLFVRVAQVIDNFKQKTPNEKKPLGALKSSYIDMEFFEYRPEFSGGLDFNHLFWKSVAQPFVVQQRTDDQPQLSEQTKTALLTEIAKELPLDSSVKEGPLVAFAMLAQTFAAQIEELSEAEAAEYESSLENHPLRFLTETWMQRLEEPIPT